MTFLRLCSRAPWMTRRSVPIRRASVVARADTPGAAPLSSPDGTRPARRPHSSGTSRRSSDRCWSPASARPSACGRPGALPRRRDGSPSRGRAAGPARRTRRSAGSAWWMPTAAGCARSRDGPNDDAEPRWSPDGARLSFRSRSRREGAASAVRAGAPRLPAEARQLTALPGVGRVAPVVGRRYPHAGGARRAQPPSRPTRSARARSAAEPDVPAWVPEVESSDDAESERRSLWVVRGRHRRGAPRSRRSSQRLGSRLVRHSQRRRDRLGRRRRGRVVRRRSRADRPRDRGTSAPLATSDVQLGWVAGSPAGDARRRDRGVCSDRVVVCGDLRVIESASGAVSPVDTR